MKEMPIDDFFAKNGKIREDGRMVHDMYLVQVKKPAESKGPMTITRSSRRSRAIRLSVRWKPNTAARW